MRSIIEFARTYALIYGGILQRELPGEIFPAEHMFTIIFRSRCEKLKLPVEIVSTAPTFTIALGNYVRYFEIFPREIIEHHELLTSEAVREINSNCFGKKSPTKYFKTFMISLPVNNRCTKCASMKCGFWTTDGAPEQFVL